MPGRWCIEFHIVIKNIIIDCRAHLFNVTMSEDAPQLNEVVVTAMGIERKEKSLTYATQKVSGDAQDANLLTHCRERRLVLHVFKCRWRWWCIKDFIKRVRNNSPLVVVDGIPKDQQY